ncbi:response regulator [Sphingomonas gilva]|uniref:histidine kinase n=1 Tax=Sphingomonas gilva TaxID=2305907 RepID=A0A396S6G2_9SPHN|nr:response regulator [Sphingomonas gilva]RHW19005.1 response regulator [Sphingomonas gilva]
MSRALPRLLYIDDDEGLRQLTAKALSRRGFDVTLAAGGAEGAALAAEQQFDLIAVDHYMPGMDGLETLAKLRQRADCPPILYVTGSEESRIAVAALKAGAADYVVKTVGDEFFDLFATACHQALDQVAMRRESATQREALEASNARLEALLKEVNHRVANSLQLVSAFVQLQARALEDGPGRAALQDTQQRITAIGQVHRRLYTSNEVEGVDMADYLTALTEELTRTWSTPAARRILKLDSEPIRLPTDKAVSLGVIVSELVSNACKYAYPEDKDGEIRVALRREDPHHFVLRVEDDGCGMPHDGAIKGTGVGTKLIAAMAKSLKSAIEVDGAGQGVKATLRAAVA